MQFEPSALAVLFAVFVGLWPVACLLALIHHSFTRQWRRVGRVALLLPLWTIAASVGLTQMAPFLAAPGAAPASTSPFAAAAGIGFALCCAAAAWWLLLRSFGGRSSSGSAHES
jgi:hypothetical protein